MLRVIVRRVSLRGAARALILFIMLSAILARPDVLLKEISFAQSTPPQLFYIAAQENQAAADSTAITLAEIERLALTNNPTLAQAEAAIRAARGRSRQAGLWPNPVVGYQGEEFAFRAFDDKSKHSFFVEQTIPLGGKIGKSRRVFDREIVEAEVEAVAQKQRVLNSVRMLYWEALGAQRRVALRAELARIAAEAVKTTSELFNVGQADQPDHLESEIEAEQAGLELARAQNDYEQTWRLLASIIGAPDMKAARLGGDLEAQLPRLDQTALTGTLLSESPEIKSSRAEIERARAVVARAKAERAPDLFLRGSIGYSNELLETRAGLPLRKTGPEASIEIGVTLPVFNRNQGAIQAAEAELTLAERDLARVELALRARLAEAFRSYNNAIDAATRYRETILPRAERAYQLYLTSFRRMAASYPQVLIAQRTLFQVREKYLDALVALRKITIEIEGFLLTGALNQPRLHSQEQSSERLETTINIGARR